MSPLLLFFKAYIPEHQRRLKNGQVVTVAAYYDKRIKKAAIHAPEHTHDVSHLSDTDKAKFSNMHKEQHVAHYYERHALKRKLSTEEQLRDTLKRSLEHHEANGDKKSAAITRKKIAALSLRIGTHKNMHERATKIVEGIGKLKHQMVEGSGELKEDADKAHAHYVGKLGERFKSNSGSGKFPLRESGQPTDPNQQAFSPSFDEFKKKNPELSENRAKSRWAGEVHDAWNAGHDVPEKTLNELKEIRPAFIPDGLADDNTLLERLGSKVTSQIENEIGKKQYEHQKELPIFKRKETLDRKKGIDFRESNDKHAGKLVSLTKEIESLKDELHQRKYTDKLNGKHALRIVGQYRDLQLKKHNDLKNSKEAQPTEPVTVKQATEGTTFKIPEQAEAKTALDITEHTTKKGKVIRGIVRKDLTHAQAKAIDEYTFKKDGGYFIREKHLEASDKLDAAKDKGIITPKQHTEAKQALAAGTPQDAANTLAEQRSKTVADKMRKTANSLLEKSQAEQNRDRQTNTRRRAGMAANSINNALVDEATAKTMHNLADAIESGDTKHLYGVNSKAIIEQLDNILRNAIYSRDTERFNSYAEREKQKGRPAEQADIQHAKYPWAQLRSENEVKLIAALKEKRGGKAVADQIRQSNTLTEDLLAKITKLLGEKETNYHLGWYPIAQLKDAGRLKRAGINNTDELHAALSEYINFKEGKKTEDPVTVAERALVGQNLGFDYFPTPKPLAQRMAELAGIKAGDTVLEPSAGNGNLADAAKSAGGKVEALEISHTLRNVLDAKKHQVIGHDFETHDFGSKQYDAVIMNPPFSDSKDAQHIQLAWDRVKPGGKLVAIAGEGVFFRSDKKAQAFRQWLDDNNADVEMLPGGTFQDKTLQNTTGANARLVVMEKPKADKPQAQQDTSPKDGDIDANGLVFRDGRWHRDNESQVKETPLASADEYHYSKAKDDDLNPNSPNYRYRDTGSIAGSKKEKAAMRIKNAAKLGERLNATDIDWDEIEQNPREAQTLINKANLFGAVDWNSLKEKGMESGTGFLVDKIYKSIGKEPEDSAAKRKYYTIGLQTIRDRLEDCKTVDDVFKTLSDIYNESTGSTITADNADEYNALQVEYDRLKPLHSAAKKHEVNASNTANDASRALYAAQRKQDDRKSRGWKPDAELDASIPLLDAKHTAAFEKLTDAKKASSESWAVIAPIWARQRELTKLSETKNLHENPTTAAWNALGKNFLTLIKPSRRSLKYANIKSGSDTFLDHAINAKSGKITDWSWAEKDSRTTGGNNTPREKPFQLLVADKITRTGGKQINIDSTSALKDLVGLRDVQSGVWVLKDKTSAEFHVQKCAEAFSDLSDILGVPLDKIALNGRLAMAFGARGSGNALAHYESVQRVINLTKMKGGGSLAHEWLHSLDNTIAEIETGKKGSVRDFLSETPELLPDGKIKDAMVNLRKAMLEGDTPAMKLVNYTAQDFKTAKYNFDNASYGLAKEIRVAGNIVDAVNTINRHYGNNPSTKSAKKWIKITAAYYGNNPEGGKAAVPTGETKSLFADWASNIDAGKTNAYWSTPKEMLARAFEAYTHDKLKAEGRENTYLTSHARNDDYESMGAYKPYPEGAERRRINAAFDEFFDALRESGTLHKAFGLKPGTMILFFKKAA